MLRFCSVLTQAIGNFWGMLIQKCDYDFLLLYGQVWGFLFVNNNDLYLDVPRLPRIINSKYDLTDLINLSG